MKRCKGADNGTYCFKAGSRNGGPEMSLNELSEKVGVANVNLSKMKNGHISAIRFSTLAAICDVLQCQPGDILEYSPEE